MVLIPHGTYPAYTNIAPNESYGKKSFTIVEVKVYRSVWHVDLNFHCLAE